MKKISIFLSTFFLGWMTLQAQNADEIIQSYHEVTGGTDAWAKVTGMKMKGSVNQGGMEIPVTVIQLKSGKQLVSINLQGKEIVQSAFDGEVLWSTNFQTMKPEKADAEMLMMAKEQAKDFPDALTDYKKKGYKAELVGTETMDGVETHKVKLTKKPLTIEGEEIENIEYYYFDKESNILIATESEIKMGPQKGSVAQNTFSDYQEVDGLYFPFSISQGIKGGGSQPLAITEIIINPEVNKDDFSFPAEEADATEE